jgi:hypothetical protein
MMETSENITLENPQEQSMSGFIREICNRFGPRVCGTAAEAKTAHFLAEKMHEFSNEVSLEEHSFSPYSIRWSSTFHLVVYLAALAAYYYLPAVTVVLIGVSLSVFFLSRLRGYEVLEQFYPQAKTQNVIGKIKPAKETRQIVIFSGHHDSAYYMPLFEKRFQRIFLYILFFIAASHGIILPGAILRILGPSSSILQFLSFSIFLVSAAAGILFFILRLFLFSNTGVMGANDNLAAVGVVFAAGAFFAAHRPEHVEIWIASFGAEEVGLRGSKRFAHAHRRELGDAMVINLEMVGAGTPVVVAGERMAGATHSPEVVSLIVQAASNCGINLRKLVGLFGETDASSFTRCGIRASTLASFDKDGAPPNWHLLTDTPENVDEVHLRNALKVCIECINIIEKSFRPATPETALVPDAMMEIAR